MRQNVRNLSTFIHNCWKMHKLLWSYRSWDFSSALDMLLFYLEDFQTHIESCRHHPNHKYSQVANHVRNLRMVREESYCKDEWAAHDKRWGRLRHRYGRRHKDGSREFILYRSKANSLARRVRESREHRLIMQKECGKRKQALLALRRLLGRDIFSYWC